MYVKIHSRRAGTDLNEASAVFLFFIFFEEQELISTKRALATVGDAAKQLLDTAYYYICVLITLCGIAHTSTY